jgi:hypothetical protein
MIELKLTCTTSPAWNIRGGMGSSRRGIERLSKRILENQKAERAAPRKKPKTLG